MNSRAQADAIAATFVGVSATVESETKTLTADTATALLPNGIAKGPILLVFPPSGSLGILASATRNDFLDYPVRLLIDPLDMPTRTAWLYAWYDAMRDRVETNVDLGQTDVYAECVSFRQALNGATYADASFDMVEIVVRVHSFEHVSTAAP